MWFKRGDDGLTNRQRKKAARRFWKIADMKVAEDVRYRARQRYLDSLRDCCDTYPGAPHECHEGPGCGGW